MRPGLAKPLCAECGKPRDRCRAVVRHVDGRLDVVCPQCWTRLAYDTFLRESRRGVTAHKGLTG